MFEPALRRTDSPPFNTEPCCDVRLCLTDFVMRLWDFVVIRWAGLRLFFFAALHFSIVAYGADVNDNVKLRDQLVRLGYEQIELRRSGENRLFLFGKLDRRKHSVLVDTGWSFTTVSTDTADKLEVRGERKRSPGDALSSTNEHSSAVLINRLRLGSVPFTNQPALVQNMIFNGQRAPFDVVLGCDFLIRSFAMIDCLNRRLYTRHAKPSQEQQTEFESSLRQSGFLSVELRRASPLSLICPARLNGKSVDLLVDTGAVWSCLDTDLARSLGLQLLPTPRQLTGSGMTGRRGFAVAKVGSVELGGAKIPGQNFAVLELRDWGLAAPGAALGDVHGILGGAELAAYNAVIDCHGLKLWLKPLSASR